MAIKNIKNPNPTNEDMSYSNYRFKKGKPTYIAIHHCDEIWKPIILPNIQDWYYISNYGNVYSKLYNCKIRPRFLGRGYYVVTLRTKDGKADDYLVHRLVMLTFHPIDNPEEMQVNHMDGIKTNNKDTNLEWATQEENMLHAYNIGLRKSGEDVNLAVISDQQAHEICRYIQLGYSDKDIAYLIDMEGHEGLIYQIRKGNNWKHISRQYNII